MIEAIGKRTIERLRQAGYRECKVDGQREFSMEQAKSYASGIRAGNPTTDVKLIASETDGLFKLLSLDERSGSR